MNLPQTVFAYFALCILLLVPSTIFAQDSSSGILLLAHGGSPAWNEEVLDVASQVGQRVPVEVAFGMATKRTIQEAADRLIQRGVEKIVVVPLFISPHSSIVTATEYLLGLRADAPPELAIYARMDHGADGKHHPPEGFDPTKPIQSSAAVSMTSPLGRHPLVSEILLSRATSISRAPEDEVVLIVAHGPSRDDENAKWLQDMQALVEPMRGRSKFHRIEYMTVRDDAPEPIRSQATTELRSRIEQVNKQGKRPLVVPLLISFGGIEPGIRTRLEGLQYEMSPQALLPDDRIAQWILLQAGIQ
jgi:sirohydrochlorin ferrochelatase